QTVFARSGDLMGTVQLRFVAGPLDVTRSRLETSAGEVIADGVSSAIVRASFADAFGNPVAGIPVELSAEGEVRFAAAKGVSGPDGAFSTPVTSTRAGTKTIVARAGGQRLETGVRFVPGPAD